MAPFGISRYGLTRCPGCKAHLKASTLDEPAVCPFCAAELGDAAATGGLMKLASSSRSALLAASLFAGTGLAACDDSSSGDPASDTADDTEVSDILVEDIPEMQPYGIPPMDVGPDVESDAVLDTAADTATDVVGDVIEDIPNMQPYGIPPDGY
jgi:hypothetical protein